MEPRVLEDNRNAKGVEKAKEEIKVNMVNLSLDEKDDLLVAQQVTAP